AKSDVAKTEAYLNLAEARQFDAARGAALALAALREAMGVGCDYPLDVADARLPTLRREIARAEVVSLAVSHRGELVQAQSAAEVVHLEIDAQEATCMPTAHTFAAFVDVHARPIPSGVSNTEYRPGAIGL